MWMEVGTNGAFVGGRKGRLAIKGVTELLGPEKTVGDEMRAPES